MILTLTLTYISVDHEGLLRPPRSHLFPAAGQVAGSEDWAGAGRGGHQAAAALHHSRAAQTDAGSGGVPESEAENILGE